MQTPQSCVVKLFLEAAMNEKRLILPNDANGFILDEMRERFVSGHTVTIAFGGNSMLPLIDGGSDRVELEEVKGDLQRGEVYLFVHQGHCVVHRLMRIDGDELVFRGDNNRCEERVSRDAILARLVSVIHKDGIVERCDSAEWRRKSRRVTGSRTLKNLLFALFGRRQRRWQRWVYMVLLLILMWAPMGFIGLPLNNFVFGIRFDHLLHASVYIPFVFFIMDFSIGRSRKFIPHWLVALLFAVTTETVQWLLPYRGFDINDLVANFLGVTLGWFLVLLAKRKAHRIS